MINLFGILFGSAAVDTLQLFSSNIKKNRKWGNGFVYGGVPKVLAYLFVRVTKSRIPTWHNYHKHRSFLHSAPFSFILTPF